MMETRSHSKKAGRHPCRAYRQQEGGPNIGALCASGGVRLFEGAFAVDAETGRVWSVRDARYRNALPEISADNRKGREFCTRCS